MLPCFSEDGNIILQIGSGEKTSIKSPAKETSKMEVRAETISFTELDKVDLKGNRFCVNILAQNNLPM